MLHLALAALLAGSLGLGDAVNPSDTDKNPPTTTEAPVGLVVASESDAPVPTTYAFGRSQGTLLQVWAGYGWATVDEWYSINNPGKEGTDLGVEIVSQRAFFGAQLNVIRGQNFSFGVGGEVAMASREFSDIASTGFQLQQAKVYAEIRGRTLGIHGGYIMDLADDYDPQTLEPHLSKGSDAFYFGGSFDYPSSVVRVFGGIDYVRYTDTDALFRQAFSATESQNAPSFMAFHGGLGFNISWIEIGAAAIMRTDIGVTSQGFHGGSHQGSIAPYLNISPPSLPVSLSIRGAFTDQFADYGFSFGGGGDLKTSKGFTAALSYGF